MRRSFADIVQYPYLSYNTDEPILLLGDCWEHIFKYLTGDDYVNLLLISRGFHFVIRTKRKLMCWSIKQLDRLERFNKEIHTTARQRLRRIAGVRQLEELLEFPNVSEIRFQKQFPTNRNKQKRELRCGFIPKLTRIIHFGGFNNIIHQGAIPRFIVEIYFGDCFNQYLDPVVFNELDNLKILVLGTSFNNGDKPMNSKALPRSLEILEINSVYFDQDLTNLLNNLPNLTTLKLGKGYKTLITKLSLNIKYLIVSDAYNQDLIQCIINSGITYLKVGKEYKHYFDPIILQSQRKIKLDIDEESYKEFLFNRWKMHAQHAMS